MADELIGPAAGIAASGLWVFTSLCFTEAGRRIGGVAVNQVRLIAAVLLNGVTYILLTGRIWPEMHPTQFWYLAGSALVGLVICDLAQIWAYMMIGPRLALLVAASTPIFALVLGVVFLGERPGPGVLAGVGLTVAGIAWAVLERRPTPRAAPTDPKRARMGVALAVVAALTQAGGSMLSKLGMSAEGLEGAAPIEPQHAVFVRMVIGAAMFLPLSMVTMARMTSRPRGEGGRMRWRAGLVFATLGAVTGPFLANWCSLTTIQRLELGVAQTYLTLMPVLILPVVAIVYKERITWRAALGAAVAFAGVTLMSIAK